ncbi:hypothetical protein DY000_02060442 [Brassica cretica]|uniref:Retrotransposon gag domain-containing protein n=1 Tax=Brassica cretica TaxID=69181 RepID=A0ABQ7AXM4_BRACR|nr:hypothetical protein DY000_02060442 [Brassica cretica]
MACQQATTFESKRRSTTISVSLDATQRKAEMPKITIIRVDEKGVLRYHAGRAYGANCQLIQEQGLQSLMKFLLLYILELNGGEHYKTTTELIRSMTCWEEVKNALINNFFDDTRYLELRNKISTFCQGNLEGLKNSCQRLTSYQRECPHHGYPELQPVSIFFRGLGPDY